MTVNTQRRSFLGALMDLKLVPVSFHVEGLSNDLVDLKIERRNTNPDKWALVTPFKDVLNKNGEWEHEPMPSSRTDEFKARTRFDSPQEIVDFIKDHPEWFG